MKFLCWFVVSIFFYRCTFIISLLLLLFSFISILKRIISVIGQHVVMSSSSLPKVIIMTRCRPIVRTNLFQCYSSLSVVDDRYSFIRTRTTLESLITSIEILEPPLFWYNLLDNGNIFYANYLDKKIVCLYLYWKHVVLFDKRKLMKRCQLQLWRINGFHLLVHTNWLILKLLNMWSIP